MNILITSIGRRVQLVQHLKKTFTVIGADATGNNAARHFVDNFFIIPKCNEKGYIDELLKICIDNSIELIIPLYEGEFEILCDNRQTFEKNGIKLLLSDKEIIQICNDKNKTQKFFEDEGIICPAVTEHAPAVIKPVYGMGSQGIYVVDTDEELQAARILSHNNYIMQEKIDGTEYTIDVLCDFNGNVVAAVPRVRTEVRAGEVAKSATVFNQYIIDYTVKMIKALNRYGNVVGPLTVQCFLKENGEIVFLEINPRFGGGVPLTFEAGVDYGAYIKLFMDGYSHVGEICDFKELSMLRYDMAVYKNVGD
ncbi:MAG: ATP-grasp domain-containing protein [Lachnospiraceae bacterium]|nr:ATP-grasp domain-containing protein [Lachnospiraceae bacterium]MDE6231893.1 ATP-grasp domain-containing protein [Lachnospiraceae bacterium]MDE6252004.1 ATP-grasp domain-containing protein [Lachnospiraceae bacterium]